MTYRCEACHEVQPHGERPHTVVMEERYRTYSTLDIEGKPHRGSEVVKEMKLCEPCAILLEDRIDAS